MQNIKEKDLVFCPLNLMFRAKTETWILKLSADEQKTLSFTKASASAPKWVQNSLTGPHRHNNTTHARTHAGFSPHFNLITVEHSRVTRAV